MKTSKAKIRNAFSWERGWSLSPGARLHFSHQFSTSCGLEQANPIANSKMLHCKKFSAPFPNSLESLFYKGDLPAAKKIFIAI